MTMPVRLRFRADRATCTLATVSAPTTQRCIGRSNLLPSLDGLEQDPLSNRACRFPAHGLRAVVQTAALRRALPEGALREADGSAQAIEAQVLEVLTCPGAGVA